MSEGVYHNNRRKHYEFHLSELLRPAKEDRAILMRMLMARGVSIREMARVIGVSHEAAAQYALKLPKGFSL